MAFGRRRVAAAVCVLPLVLAGCAADPEPKLAPPAETPTTESSPSATPTREPWEKKTNAGAVAFARHWIEVFNEAARSGNTDELAALDAETCGSCRSFAQLIDEIYSGGGRYESDGWQVRQSSTTDVQPSGVTTVSLRIHQPPERITRPGKPVERHDAATVTYTAELRWEEGGWLMSDLYFLS